MSLMSRSLTDRVSESLLGVSAGGNTAVARGAATVVRYLRVRLLFFVVFFLVAAFDEATEADFFFGVFFLVFFLAADAWDVSNRLASNISGRPVQSHIPKEIAPAAINVKYLLEFIICKITKKSFYKQR